MPPLKMFPQVKAQFAVNAARTKIYDLLSASKSRTFGVLDDDEQMKVLDGAYQRVLRDNPEIKPEEMIYWHRDTANGGDGIERIERYPDGAEYGRKFLEKKYPKHLWYRLLNEPLVRMDEHIWNEGQYQTNLKIFKWCMDAARVMIAAGYKVMLVSDGLAKVQWQYVSPTNGKKGLLDDYILFMDEFADSGQVIADWHEYAPWWLPFHCGSRDPRLILRPHAPASLDPKNFPTTQEIRDSWRSNWLEFRSTSWYYQRLTELNAERAKKNQRKLKNGQHGFSEFGWDDLPNLEVVTKELEAQFGGRFDTYGHRTLQILYNEYLTKGPLKWSYDFALFEQLRWRIENAPPEYNEVFYALFLWDDPLDWGLPAKGFRWEDLPDTHKFWIMYGTTGIPDAPSPVPVPKPTNAAEPKIVFMEHAGGLSLRTGNGLNYDVVEIVVQGARLTYYSQPRLRANDYDWVWTETSTKSGWVALIKSEDELFEPVPPPTSPTPMPKPDNAGTGERVRVQPPGELVNLRDGAGTEYTDIGDVLPGDVVTLFRATKRRDSKNLNDWYWIESSKGNGWIAELSKTQFEVVPSHPILIDPEEWKHVQVLLGLHKQTWERVADDVKALVAQAAERRELNEKQHALDERTAATLDQLSQSMMALVQIASDFEEVAKRVQLGDV